MSTHVYRTEWSWVGEVRTEGEPGRVIGLVWQSGFYLTRRGARNALRWYLYTGSPDAELLRRFAGWRRLLMRLPRLEDEATGA